MKNTGQFQKGHIPQCPIRLGEHRGKSTEFKPSHTPTNKLVMGSVTIRKDKSGRQRAWIKVAEPNRWILRAVYVWLSSGAYISKGFIIHHLNKDSLDDHIDNLALVTKAKHVLLHTEELQAGKRRRQNERNK